MWKSAVLLRAATLFYPQAILDESKVFHRDCGEYGNISVIHISVIHIPQPLWKLNPSEN
jgi:hypothetical protein